MENNALNQNEAATLYIVSTPIGHLDDMTFRGVETLKRVDYILAEDTRVSGNLLKAYGIDTPLKSYHAHNEKAMTEGIINWLEQGFDLALISDAGTPLIADPGETLIKTLSKAGFNLTTVPGPTALISGLIMSGIETHPFTFYGFLPQKTTARDKLLKGLISHPYTLVFYESPKRIHKTLEAMYRMLGDREAFMAREMTKLYEETYRFTLSEYGEIPELKGEIVLVIKGSQEAPLIEGDMVEHVELLMEDGLREMDAIKKVAKLRNLKKNTVYMAFQNAKKKDEE